MKGSKYTLWKFSDIALDFNTDNEIMQYLNDNDIKYEIVIKVKNFFIKILIMKITIISIMRKI